MKDNIQPCEVIESNLLNPNKEMKGKLKYMKDLMDNFVINTKDLRKYEGL